MGFFQGNSSCCIERHHKKVNQEKRQADSKRQTSKKTHVTKSKQKGNKNVIPKKPQDKEKIQKK